MSVEAFGIEKEFLHDLLRQVRDGRIQLPEFQRGWVWPVENIVGLLASISLGYPIGTVMMLRSGGDARFAQRGVEGASLSAGASAERLLLDGQQRLTSLFQALMLGRPVDTEDEHKRKLSGWFYVDIEGALNETYEREETFRFVPADRKVRDFRSQIQLDVSSREREYAADLFPLDQVFDPDEWAAGFQEHHEYNKTTIKLWNAFNRQFIKRFEQYLVPVIEMGAATPREAVCQVFEKVNTGGVTLTVFELLTATYAAEEFSLRDDWKKRAGAWADSKFHVLSQVAETDFLQAVTLLATYERRKAFTGDSERAPRIGCRRADMLRLTLADYERWAPEAVRGLHAAAKFLHSQYIFDVKFIPYGTQLIPLSAIFAVLGTEAESYASQQKIAHWFWCGVFGELYGGTTETRFARDLPDVVAWIRRSGDEPRTVQEAQFLPTRLRTLRTRNSAAYKGLYALLLKDGAVDWRTGESINAATYFDEAIDIHHVYPKVWCDRQGIDRAEYDSIINKTALSARTNRIIGGLPPSKYRERLANSAQTGVDTVDKHVRTHLIDTGLLWGDDFAGFLTRRERDLLDRIGSAMNKSIGGASSERF